MAWVETESLSFTARHETEDDGCAQRTLDRLEDLRLRLEERFDDAPGGITVVVHPSPGWLAAAHPFLPGGPARRRPGGAALPRGLGDGLGAARAERRVHRPPRRRRGLARRAARHRRAPLRADRDRRQQRAPAAAVGPAQVRPLRALGVADRGRRPVLRRPDCALPRRGQHPDAPGQAAVVPALGARRDHPRRHRLSTCSSASAGPTRARSWSHACAARAPSGRSSSPSTSASATSSASGAATCARTCPAPARSTSSATRTRSRRRPLSRPAARSPRPPARRSPARRGSLPAAAAGARRRARPRR